jgi:3-phosphoshikimate 1-carboxyvinyltransferase
MNYVKISPSKLSGDVTIPPSKSLSHRAVIASGLSKGESIVENVMFSQDIIATCSCMEALGVAIEKIQTADNIYTLKVTGTGTFNMLKSEIDCFESGSTLRFFIPISLITQNNVTFKGRGKLVSRPLNEYYKIFDKQSIKYNTTEGNLPLTVNGCLSADEFEIAGNVSSQFITGLLFALPLLKNNSTIKIIGNLESKGYVDLTLDILKKFSIEVVNDNYHSFYIKGNQEYKNYNYRVEGDFSQAAFWLVAGAIGGDLTCFDLNPASLQGDKEVLDIIKRMNADIKEQDNKICAKTSNTKHTLIDGSQCPDIIPVLAVLASVSEGTTEIINAGRLRIKESDRLTAITTELKKLGADIAEKNDGLIITGKAQLNGGEVNSWNDHRIAMSLAVASLRCTNDVIIKDSGCINKSYPTFWEDFRKLGGNIDEWSLG